MSKQSGILYVSINGALLQSQEGAELDMGGMEREPVMANGAVVGYREKPVAATVKCKLAHDASTDEDSIREFTDGNMVFETDAGRKYSIGGAFCSKPPVLSRDGLACEFAGKASKVQ